MKRENSSHVDPGPVDLSPSGGKNRSAYLISSSRELLEELREDPAGFLCDPCAFCLHPCLFFKENVTLIKLTSKYRDLFGRCKVVLTTSEGHEAAVIFLQSFSLLTASVTLAWTVWMTSRLWFSIPQEAALLCIDRPTLQTVLLHATDRTSNSLLCGIPG